MAKRPNNNKKENEGEISTRTDAYDRLLDFKTRFMCSTCPKIVIASEISLIAKPFFVFWAPFRLTFYGLVSLLQS
jgi:hypothetical protein